MGKFIAAAEVDLLCLLVERRSSHICCSCTTGLTEPLNNYRTHTNRNTRTNTSTHEDTPPSRDAVEVQGKTEGETGAGIKGRGGTSSRRVGEELLCCPFNSHRTGVAELRLQSGFSLHISFFFFFLFFSPSISSAQSCGMHPTPPPPPSCTHFAPAFAKPIPPSLPSSSSPFIRALLTLQNTPVPLPLLSAGAHFSPDIFLNCVCVCMCPCECMCALSRLKRRCCLCGY